MPKVDRYASRRWSAAAAQPLLGSRGRSVSLGVVSVDPFQMFGELIRSEPDEPVVAVRIGASLASDVLDARLARGSHEVHPAARLPRMVVLSPAG